MVYQLFKVKNSNIISQNILKSDSYLVLPSFNTTTTSKMPALAFINLSPEGSHDSSAMMDTKRLTMSNYSIMYHS